MRQLLLAGIALGAVSVMASMNVARADDTTPPAAVFPVTSETDLAGWNGPSLNGAAPGSVQVNLGGRTFSALYFENVFLKDTPAWAKPSVPQFMSYFFLYPGFDYASPSGIHFGAQAEIRMTSAQQAGSATPWGGVFNGGGSNTNAPIPWFHEYFTYVSSPIWGKVQFGIPNGALVANAVGTGDDFGTGVYFSWYNTGVPWVMADAPDNDISTQKAVYTSPTFAGFTGAISFQPNAVSANYSDGLTVGQDPACLPGNGGPGCSLLSRNRIEMAGKYTGTFGPVGVKANLGYVTSQAEKASGTPVGQHVSYGNVGAELHIAGFELEGSALFGKWNPNPVNDGNPGGPLPIGAKNTTAWIVGVGYANGPIKVGAVYYHVAYDALDFGGPAGTTGRVTGPGLGAAYTVGPGVVLYLDATTATFDTLNFTGTTFGAQHPAGLGIGTFFTW